MNRLAVFVEGYTEAVFVEKLIEEIAGQNKVLIEHRKIRGGRTTPRRMWALIVRNQPERSTIIFYLTAGEMNL